MDFFCWNSFQNVDVHFHLVYKTHSIEVSFFTPTILTHSSSSQSFSGRSNASNNSDSSEDSDRNLVLDSKMWAELAYSSVFRFWYPPDPLYRALFGFQDTYYPALRLVPPKPLSIESIRYVLQNYTLCEDAYCAIAAYLVYLGNSTLILSLVHEFETLHPHLACNLLHFIPKIPSCSLFHSLFGYIEEAFYKCPDDALLVSTFIECSLILLGFNDSDLSKSSNFEGNRTDHLIPFLVSSCWSTPIACIGLARLCLREGLEDEAFYALNAACFAKNPLFHPKVPKTPLAIIGAISVSKQGLIPQLKRFEANLIKTQPQGIDFLFYDAILSFVRKITPVKTRVILLKHFPHKKNPRNFDQKPRIRKYTDISSSDFSEKSDFTDHEGSSDISDTDTLQLLFDPGVTGGLAIPAAMKLLPQHEHFSEVLNKVIEDAAVLSDSLQGVGESPSLEKAEEACMVALRTKNKEVFDVAANLLKHYKKHRMVHELVGAKIGIESGEIREMTVEPGVRMTVQESNTFLVLREILSGLSEILKSI